MSYDVSSKLGTKILSESAIFHRFSALKVTQAIKFSVRTHNLQLWSLSLQNSIILRLRITIRLTSEKENATAVPPHQGAAHRTFDCIHRTSQRKKRSVCGTHHPSRSRARLYITRAISQPDFIKKRWQNVLRYRNRSVKTSYGGCNAALTKKASAFLHSASPESAPCNLTKHRWSRSKKARWIHAAS